MDIVQIVILLLRTKFAKIIPFTFMRAGFPVFMRGWRMELFSTGKTLHEIIGFVMRNYAFLKLSRIRNRIMLNLVHQFKVIKPIVCSISVLVMNYFAFIKRTIKVLRHNIAVFWNTSVRTSIDMFGVVYNYITFRQPLSTKLFHSSMIQTGN